MALIITFLLGIGNFALHKAVLESGSPLLEQIPAGMRALGGRTSLTLEFLLLLGAMLLVGNGQPGWGWAYFIYSLVNGGSAWWILSHRR